MDNAKLAALGDRAKALHDLAKTPGWAALQEIYAERLERYGRHLAHQALIPGHVLDQREIDFNAGFFDAMKRILAAPEKTEATLEKVLRRQEGIV